MAWLTNYRYRKKITVSRADGAVSNYQMKISLATDFVGGNAGTDIAAGKVSAGYQDLRFTTSDGTTLLDYCIESTTTSNTAAVVWVEFDSIGTTGTEFYMYYGYSGATAGSNGTNTFLHHDGFEYGADGDTVGAGQFTEDVAHCHVSTDTYYYGTRCGKLVGGITSPIMHATHAMASTAEAVQFQVFKESIAEDAALFITNASTGTATTAAYVALSAGGSLKVYNGAAWVATTSFNEQEWERIELRNFNWTAGTMEISINEGDPVTGIDISYYPTDTAGILRFYGDDTSLKDTYIDNFFIRNWRSVEPEFAAWGEEEEYSETFFPTSIDIYPDDKTTGDMIPSVDWNRYTSAICAVEAKVGVNTSTVNTSLDWKLTSAGSYDPGHRHDRLFDSTGTQLLLLDSGDISASPVSAIYVDNVKYGIPAASAWPASAGVPTYRMAANSFFGSNLQDEGGIITKETTEDITNATLQNDNELVFALTAGGCYRFEALLFVEGCSAADITYDWDPPTGATMYWTNEAFALGIETTPSEARTGPDTSSRGLANVDIEIIHRHWGIIFAGDGGNFRLQWAQAAASAYPTSVLQRSNIQVWRIY